MIFWSKQVSWMKEIQDIRRSDNHCTIPNIEPLLRGDDWAIPPLRYLNDTVDASEYSRFSDDPRAAATCALTGCKSVWWLKSERHS
jgi:hypothetical protein